MRITTTTPEDTDRLVALAESHSNIRKIRHILSNKHNATDQIKAIKKIVVPLKEPSDG